jgi:tetratricopeptide (TPR) repeat protein
MFQQLDFPAAEGQARNNLGWLLASTGDYEGARQQCEASLRLRLSIGYHIGTALTLDSLGYIEHLDGQHARAVEYYERSLALRRELQAAYLTADTLEHLGDPYVALGQHDRARAVWREALELYQAQHRPKEADHLRHRLDELTP